MYSKKRVSILLVLVVISIIGISLVSANWFSDLFKIGKSDEGLEGELPEAHQAQVQIGNDPPEILNISSPPPEPLLAIEDNGTGTKTTSMPAILFVAWDPNGVGDLPTTNIIAAGYVERSPNTPHNYIDAAHTRRYFNAPTVDKCRDNGTVPAGPYGKPPATFARVYICNVSMWYYDDPKPWNVTITGFKDNATVPASAWNLPFSAKDVFSLNENNGFYTIQNILDFGTVNTSMIVGVSSTSPVVMKNTANRNFNALSPERTFDFTGRNLTGLINFTEKISADNFNTNLDYPPPINCNNSVQKIILQDSVQVPFPLLLLPNGDHLNGSDAKKTVYFCLTRIKPSDLPLTVQTYSTTGIGTGPWIIDY